MKPKAEPPAANATLAFAAAVFCLFIPAITVAHTEAPHTYDSLSRRTQTVLPPLTGAPMREHRYSYNGTTVNTFDARDQLTESRTALAATTYTWDKAGNLTKAETGATTVDYTWNAERQLTGVKRNNTQIAAYRYTHGLRDQSQTNDGTTRTVWESGFAYLQQNDSGQTRTRTEHAGDKALYLSGEQGNEILLRDGLDSITGSVSGTALQSQTAYSAWGEATQNGVTQSKHGYTGHLKDEETGLIYARARYYDPGLGRFISRDSLEGLLDNPITWNASLYGNANPLKYVDPTGLLSIYFDGTWNDRDDPSKALTNIGRMYGVSNDPDSKYIAGVGTLSKTPIFDAAFGLGVKGGEKGNQKAE